MQQFSAMAAPADVEMEDRNAALYHTLKDAEKSKVVELCRQMGDGALHVLTIHDDTVLHMAAYTGEAELVSELLQLVKLQDRPKLTLQNKVGNTVLHEAAAFDGLVKAAEQMLVMTPDLLSIPNDFKETPLFRAVRYGQIAMFKFLDQKAKENFANVADRKRYFYQNNKKTTILHAATVAGKFELALMIARQYKCLIGEEDEYGMTALQHLARNSSAFASKKRGFLKALIYPCLSKPTDPAAHITDEVAQGWQVPLVEKLRKEKWNREYALTLADMLIKGDISWKKTSPVEGLETADLIKQKQISVLASQTPMFLATKAGCKDIVEKILKSYPQAVEHVDVNGCTILHIAIKYRRIDILDLVEKMAIVTKKLIKKCDKNGNSILHMVGENIDDGRDEGKGLAGQARKVEQYHIFSFQTSKRNPVEELKDDLRLYHRIKKMCAKHFFNHVNFEGRTAEQVFASKNENLLNDAKEWLKNTAQNCSVIAVLIATVAFAAAYTIPGGLNDQTGAPILLNQPLFAIFTISDVLSLTCTLTSLVIFLSILTSSFALKDFRKSLPRKLAMGFASLIMSVAMMMVAFSATIILMIRNKEQWTKVGLYTVAFLPVASFTLSYMPSQMSLKQNWKHMFHQIEPVLPRYVGLLDLLKQIGRVFFPQRKTQDSLPRSNNATTPSNSSEV